MIGIFDSGVGGLTVVKALKEKIPSADVVYFGDTKNAPYGEKGREELADLTINAIRILTSNGSQRIISACNSLSASMTLSLHDAFSLPVGNLIEMVGPTVASFKGSDARVLVCATQATAGSHIYQNAFQMIGKEVTVVPFQSLAGSIEAGKGEEEIESVIRQAFKGVRVEDFDVVVLACTHYPLVVGIFKRVLGDVAIFNPADEVAERAENLWWPQEANNGKLRFLVSRDTDVFREYVATLFPDTVHTIEVVE